MGQGDGYVSFDDARVFLDGMQLMCAVEGRTVPLRVIILHSECTLSRAGDVGAPGGATGLGRRTRTRVA
jgi:hypothetical protein